MEIGRGGGSPRIPLEIRMAELGAGRFFWEMIPLRNDGPVLPSGVIFRG